MSQALLVEDLVKRYGDVLAVDGLSFSVERGEIYGLLGPNGAGKTTTLEIVEGLLRPDSGRVTVLGLDGATQARAIKSRIGVQLQSSSYYEYLTLAEILALLGRFYPRRLLRAPTPGVGGPCRQEGPPHPPAVRWRAAAIRPCRQPGQRPGAGDFGRADYRSRSPVRRRDLWALVRQVRERGATVIVTTHYMEEAQEMCDRVAIINHGRLLAEGSPRELIGRIEASYAVKLVTTEPLSGEQLESLSLNGHGLPVADGSATFLRLDGSPAALQDLLHRVEASNVALEQIEITPVTLEDVFLELTRN